jgi:hypothetical protein
MFCIPRAVVALTQLKANVAPPQRDTLHCTTALRLTAERLMSSREQLVISSPLCECWKNVQFAARPLAPYPDMALGPGRSHMNRFDII